MYDHRTSETTVMIYSEIPAALMLKRESCDFFHMQDTALGPREAANRT